jgi:hypothetical protein
MATDLTKELGIQIIKEIELSLRKISEKYSIELKIDGRAQLDKVENSIKCKIKGTVTENVVNSKGNIEKINVISDYQNKLANNRAKTDGIVFFGENIINSKWINNGEEVRIRTYNPRKYKKCWVITILHKGINGVLRPQNYITTSSWFKSSTIKQLPPLDLL